MSVIQALIRNSGTCRPDVKGETQVDGLRKGESTEAGHRGGVVRSRVESPVMGPDQRNGAVQLCHTDNPEGEDQRG